MLGFLGNSPSAAKKEERPEDYPEPASWMSPYPAVLEVGGQTEGAPRQYPVSLQNLSAGVVTLEINWPGIGTDWENLAGRVLKLHLLPGDPDASLEIMGRVKWVRFLGNAKNRLSLGLELAKASAAAQQALEDQIHHTSKDIKDLWARWDQLRDTPTPSLADRRLFLVGLALLVEGGAFQLFGLKSLALFGLSLIFLGCLALVAKILYSWQQTG